MFHRTRGRDQHNLWHETGTLATKRNESDRTIPVPETPWRSAFVGLLAFSSFVAPFTCGVRASELQLDLPAWCRSPAAQATADGFAAKFDQHPFIFIGSTHGDAKIEEFLSCLLSRPAFTSRVTDIVTEWASSGHQRLLDRYILELEPVPKNDLAAIFLDNDSPELWTTLPQVWKTLEALRAVNRTLEPAKRIRLVGGNEGFDWPRVKTAADLSPYPYKTNLIPHLLGEHLAKVPGNRTLVVYGEAHIRFGGRNFMTDLEVKIGRAKLFVVGTVRELEPKERDYLADLGDPSAPFFVDAANLPRKPWPDSLRTSLEERSDQPLSVYLDAVLYLGPEKDRHLKGALPLSEAQQRELERRNAIKYADPQAAMRTRSQGRSRWFESHPNDFVARPSMEKGSASGK